MNGEKPPIFLGEIFEKREKERSKIEKGLFEFRIYRVARHDKILSLCRDEITFLTSGSDKMNEILKGALFFTTQKGMALEYRWRKENYILLEERGVDFLDDLKKLEEQGLKVILFSHKDIYACEQMKDEEEKINFYKRHIFVPSRISLRNLRRAAEIIVLMPDHMNVLPLSQKKIKKQGIKGLLEKKKKGVNPSGLFHKRIVEINERKDKYLEKMQKFRKRLLKEKSDIIVAMSKKENYDNSVLGKKLDEVNRQLEEVESEIDKRLADFHSFFRDENF